MTAEQIKSRMDSHASFALDELTEAALREAGCLERVAVLPEQFNERVRCLGNLLVQMLTKTPEDGQLRGMVGTLAQSLSYMLNSASWRDGVLHDFDAHELKRKLQRFAGRDER